MLVLGYVWVKSIIELMPIHSFLTVRKEGIIGIGSILFTVNVDDILITVVLKVALKTSQPVSIIHHSTFKLDHLDFAFDYQFLQ